METSFLTITQLDFQIVYSFFYYLIMWGSNFKLRRLGFIVWEKKMMPIHVQRKAN